MQWHIHLLAAGVSAVLATGAADIPPKASTGTASAVSAAPVNPDVWLMRAQDEQRRGLMKQALEHAGKAVEASPRDPRPLHFRAQLFERMQQLPSCEADLTKAIELAPAEAVLRLDRGILRLRLSDFPGSVADFDRYAELRPEKAAELWQRGIALFYAGRFDDARRQFELHRTVNPEDVENSAWHFCCVARLQGTAAARKALLPVTADMRVPMKEVQAMFAGALTPEEVLKAAETATPEARRASGRFYAHFYIALYQGARREREAEVRHAAEAAKLGREFGIMGEIARVHAGWVATDLSRDRAR